MTINERLRLLIRELGLNNNSFAKAIGVNPVVTFNIIEGRKTKPSFDLLEKILFTFDNVNAYWLLKGEGAVFRTNIKSAQKQSMPSQPSVTNPSTPSIETIISEHQKIIVAISNQLEESTKTNKELLDFLKKSL